MRQIVLDTETTGLEVLEGHRIIEVGCLELVNRRLTGRSLHYYLNPERPVDPQAFAVHGLSNEFLADKPRFAQIAEELLLFIKDAELIIHNATFDVGFINAELQRVNAQYSDIAHMATVIDTLLLARRKHPGQSNSLDALCRRYQIDNTHRDLHGALLDAQLLAEVYLRMTGGQVQLFASALDAGIMPTTEQPKKRQAPVDRAPLLIIQPDAEELAAHAAFLAYIETQIQTA